MPWHGVLPVDLRLQFVTEYASGVYTMTELCDDYDISRKTGYKWVARGKDGDLRDRSRRPHHCPRATPEAIVQALLEARRRHPTWSARKLIAVLTRQQPKVPWPTRSTGCDLLNAHHLVRARRRRFRSRAPAAPLAPITRPNEVWTTDFKGEFRTGDHVYCYPLTLRDGFSRFALRCDAQVTKASGPARRRFERAFATYGLPERIRSDNGGPFAATGLTRLSHLSVWWIRLGIQPERIALGHPEQNGSHEQFHRVLKAETARPPAPNRDAQQRRFDRFCAEYNDERPHEALDDQTPASRYEGSRRAMPKQLPPLEYPGHLEIRRVSCAGLVSWQGRPLYFTEVLAGEDIAFDEIDDGIWTVYFGAMTLARFDARTRTLIALPYGPR